MINRISLPVLIIVLIISCSTTKNANIKKHEQINLIGYVVDNESYYLVFPSRISGLLSN